MRRLWEKVKTELDIWRVAALPGFTIIVLVVLARLTGSLQFLELVALDNLLRLRPPEPMDERIVIVTLTQDDIDKADTYPIPDKNLADLLKKIQDYQPTVIGLDIFRDKPVHHGHEELNEIFRNSDNIIAVEQALRDRSGYTVSPPKAIHPERVGFADAKLDDDGYLRRSLLSASNPKNEFRYSLTISLAAYYLLVNEQILQKNGIKDTDAFRFGSTELTRFQPSKPFPEIFSKRIANLLNLSEMSYYGGYVGADAGGNQILLNYRSGKEPFRIISVGELNAGQLKDGTKIKPEWIRNRIVLIGVAALSAKDVVNASAVGGVNPALVYGVEAHAHAVSQIVSAVVDKRPLIQVWSIGWEYLWIFAWGILGISLGRFLRSPWKILLGLGIACGGLVIISYGLILTGLWVPVVPSLLVLVLNAAGLTVLTFYQYEYTKSSLHEKKLIIQQIVQSIHNEPIQTLKLILKESENLPQPLLFKLQHLHQELEAITNSIPREILDQKNSFQLGSDTELDLQQNLHELLHLVYVDTLEPKEGKDFPYFQTIKVKVIKFEPLNDRNLSLEDKRGLCRFLQEALINVGKYANGVTRLTVIYKQEQDKQVIQVADNGVGLATSVVENSLSQHVGTGTKQAKRLAKRLGGEFRRYPNQTKGTVCELTWPIVRS
jgi:CHASE2 domain-containing sensor protein